MARCSDSSHSGSSPRASLQRDILRPSVRDRYRLGVKATVDDALHQQRSGVELGHGEVLLPFLIGVHAAVRICIRLAVGRIGVAGPSKDDLRLWDWLAACIP